MLPRYRRLTLDQRKVISNLLSQGRTAKEIAMVLNVDPTSVSKEVRRNRIKDGRGYGKCPKTDRFPHVCNACRKRYGCRLEKYEYKPVRADEMAEFRKRDPRAGLDQDEETVLAVEAALREGCPRGKGVYKALAAKGLEKRVKASTVYDWIRKGRVSPGEGGLARKIKTKKRAKKSYCYGECPESKEGRTFGDYLRFMVESHPSHAVQMDFLGSLPTDATAVLNLHLTTYRFSMLFLLPKGSMGAVSSLFSDLREMLGAESFSKLFPVILTDNDPAFWCFREIESDPSTGELLTRVFFTDPYNGNQKGAVENSNGQIRRFFPKGRGTGSLTGAYVAECCLALAGEPVASLFGMSPAEAVRKAFGDSFYALVAKAIRALNP